MKGPLRFIAGLFFYGHAVMICFAKIHHAKHGHIRNGLIFSENYFEDQFTAEEVRAACRAFMPA